MKRPIVKWKSQLTMEARGMLVARVSRDQHLADAARQSRDSKDSYRTMEGKGRQKTLEKSMPTLCIHSWWGLSTPGFPSLDTAIRGCYRVSFTS